MPAASAETKRTYRSPRQVARHQAILSAARAALAARGYDGVTMNALADAAGVTKKTLYNLYGSKDDLLLAAVSDLITDYRGFGETGSGLDAIVASRRAAIGEIVRTPAYSDAMTIALVQATPGHALINLLLAEGVAHATAHLRHAADAGAFQASRIWRSRSYPRAGAWCC